MDIIIYDCDSTESINKFTNDYIQINKISFAPDYSTTILAGDTEG